MEKIIDEVQIRRRPWIFEGTLEAINKTNLTKKGRNNNTDGNSNTLISRKIRRDRNNYITGICEKIKQYSQKMNLMICTRKLNT